MSLITDPKVEIEFVSGVWTDVTADVDLTAGIAIQYGRTSEFSTPAVANVTYELANHTGKYTPRTQLLVDGVTAHPYYPNVLPRKRTRVSNGAGVRFMGYIKSFPPTFENGTRNYVTITANDGADRLSKIPVQPAHVQCMLADSPFILWANTDPKSSTQSVDLIDGLPLAPVVAGCGFGSVAAVPVNEGTFGISAPNVSNIVWRSSVPFRAIPAAASTSWTLEFWGVNTNAAGGGFGTGLNLGLVDKAGTSGVSIWDIGDGGASSGQLQYINGATNVLVNFPSTDAGGIPHHYCMTGTDNGSNLRIRLYIDGVLACTSGALASGDGGLTAYGNLAVETIYFAPCSVGPVALYASVLPTARIIQHVTIGAGTPTLTTGQRATEYALWAGITSGASIDAGVATVSSHPTNGKDVVTLLDELATTEGGGSASYFLPSGALRFADRTFRKPDGPAITLDASKDLLDSPFLPSFDDLNLVTSSTVSRNGGSQQIYTDPVATAAYGLTGDAATSYSSNDADVLNLAQQRVSTQSTPALRLPQFAFDALTAETSGLLTRWQNVEIGTRVRLAALPAGMKAGTTLDVIVEGWHETITKTGYVIQVDTSPADNPARFIWDDPLYGLWGPDVGSMTIGAVTASATTITITTAANHPTLTIDPAMYPLAIRVNEEEMTITIIPVSSSSPQIVTVTRGTSNTQAAPQPAGSTVSLSPAPCWTL